MFPKPSEVEPAEETGPSSVAEGSGLDKGKGIA